MFNKKIVGIRQIFIAINGQILNKPSGHLDTLVLRFFMKTFLINFCNGLPLQRSTFAKVAVKTAKSVLKTAKSVL